MIYFFLYLISRIFILKIKIEIGEIILVFFSVVYFVEMFYKRLLFYKEFVFIDNFMEDKNFLVVVIGKWVFWGEM